MRTPKTDRISQAIRALPDDELRALILELRLSTRLQQSILSSANREQTRRRRATRRATSQEAPAP